MVDFARTILVEIAKSAAKGAIGGLMDRYSIGELSFAIAIRSDLITETFRGQNLQDLALMAKLRKLAARYASHAQRIRAEVSPEFLLGWLGRNYPHHAALLQTPDGRAWFQGNYETLMDYFFPRA